MDASKRSPTAYRWVDDLSGIVLLILVVWAPWAFGCTTTWAINVLVGGCYLLGIFLVTKWILRRWLDYGPARWVEPTKAGRWALRALAGLTVLFLAWVLIGAVNARSTVEFTRAGPLLHETARTPIAWLPASYDAPMSWRAFWRWTGLALAFWAARDWLIGKTRHERHHSDEDAFPPGRLRQLFWTLALSSAALALTGMLQRFDGTTKLLWLIEPVIRREATMHFASYTYRSNAAQYFNAVWPALLGFWWALHERSLKLNPRSKLGNDPGVVLVPAVVLMMAVPFVAASRGGALLTMALVVAVMVVMTLQKNVSRKFRIGLAVAMAAALGLGLFLGGEFLGKRFETVLVDQLSGRSEIYLAGRKMVAEFGWLGSGAETFTSISHLYRQSPGEEWAGYLHDDWMETLVTLGGVGLALVIGLLGGVVAVFWTGRGIRAPLAFPALLGLGLAGLLTHAKFDLPFQIVSLQFLFVILCGVLASLAGGSVRR